MKGILVLTNITYLSLKIGDGPPVVGGKKAGFTKKMNGSKFIGIPQIIQVMDAHDLVLKAMVTWISPFKETTFWEFTI